MKWFQVHVPLDGRPGARAGSRARASGVDRFGAEAFTGRLAVKWESSLDEKGLPLHATYRNWTIVGDARIDNRRALAQSLEPVGVLTELHLILAVLDRYGPAGVSRLLGDFAFVAWDAEGHVVAARDAFGVRGFFVTRLSGAIAFASHIQLLRRRDDYNKEFIAEFLINGFDVSGRTLYQSVDAVRPGSYVGIQNGQVVETRYWCASDFEPGTGLCERDAADQFITLFRDAVATRIPDAGHTWAELSGGLDSSSVTLEASRVAEERHDPLGGTVTIVDTLGSGDERSFTELVIGRCGLRNEQIIDYWPFMDDGESPPLTDGPTANYPFFATTRRVNTIVAEGGGTVLLSGQGSDHYLTGNYAFVADLLARGRLVKAAREATRYAISSRVSVWRFAFDYGLSPLLPYGVRLALLQRRRRVPRWVPGAFARQHGMTSRIQHLRQYASAAGKKYSGQVAGELDTISSAFRIPCEGNIDVRYPFMHRPLVEFALQLPYELKTRPREKKWILREAMRGVLPEEIRTRVGKGTIGARIRWALQYERARMQELTTRPLLADLGCVEPHLLQRDLAKVQSGRKRRTTYLMNVLAMEMWLRVRAGQWDVRGPALVQQSAEPAVSTT